MSVAATAGSAPTALPDGYRPLGPDSLFWQITGDWRAGLLAGRALVLQVAHPVVGAGVGEHSVYKTDPYGRLDRTVRSTLRLVYGGTDASEEGQRLRQMHRDIKGVDARGRRYSALHPEAYLWVHATGFEFALVFFEKFDQPLDPDRRETLFQEWRTMAWTLGIPDHHIPSTEADFWQFWNGVLPKLENNPVVQDLLYQAPKPPPHVPSLVHDAISGRVLATSRQLITWTLPSELQERFALPPLTPAEVRRMHRLAGTMRLAGRLPQRLLFSPLAWRTREQAIGRTVAAQAG